MSDSDDLDASQRRTKDDREREPTQNEASGLANVAWPALGRFADEAHGSIELRDEASAAASLRARYHFSAAADSASASG